MLKNLTKISVKFEPRDVWIGVYWNLSKSVESSYRQLWVYICIVPMLPICMHWQWGWRNPVMVPEKDLPDLSGQKV